MKNPTCSSLLSSPHPNRLRRVFALVLTCLASSAFATTHLKISANGAAIDAFENWTSTVPWHQIANYRNANAGRPVIDFILELQALKAGGLDFDFELVRTINYEQAKIAVIEGRAQLTAETIWNDEIAGHDAELLKTEDIIRNGEFVKGIFVLPTNEKLLKISSLAELRAAVGAVVSSWALDLKTIEAMNLKGVEKKATPELVFQAIQKQQADFTLGEFSSNPDMSAEKGGVKLVPVPNFTVAIAGARSWIIAKSDPNSAAISNALATGVKILRDNGTIERAYRESGFFNPRIADWKRLF